MNEGSVLWYYLFPLAITLIAVIGYRRNKAGIIVLLLLLFFSMFRGDNVGNDTLRYMDSGYISTKSESFSSFDFNFSTFDFEEDFGRNLELGSLLLNYIVYKTHSSARIIIYVYALIAMLFLYFSLKKIGVSTAIGLMFYVLLSLFFFSLSASRQMAAISIFCFGITYIFNDDRKKYFFFVYLLLAALFHASAVFYFWVFFAPHIKINRNIVLIIVSAFCLFSCFTSYDIADLIYSTFKMEYIQAYEGLYDVNNRSFMGRVFDFLTFSFFIYSFYYRRKDAKEQKSDTYDVLFALAIILMALFSHVSMLIARVTYYLVIFICLYMAMLSKESNCMKKQNFLLVFFAYLVLVEYNFGVWAHTLQSGYYLMF